MPPGSNRGPYVDSVNAEFGSPLGSAWCANAVGHWLKKAGALLPPDSVGEADRWRRFALNNGWLTADPQAGAVVIYGGMGDGHAHHLGVVEQIIGKRVLTIEGNTTLVPAFDREGWIIQQKECNYARLIGYMHLRAR